MNNDLPYLTVSKFARKLGVSSRTIYDWVEAKKVTHFRIGRIIRFNPQTVDAFIQQRTILARRNAA